MSRNSRVRDRGYISSQVSISAATYDNTVSVDYLVVAGGGGGANVSGSFLAGSGGSGVVILRYLTAQGTITIGAGLTGSTATDGANTVATITAGTGNVSWA